MPNYSVFSSLVVRSAPLCVAAALTAALGCSSSSDSPSGTAGAPAAGGPSGMAGAPVTYGGAPSGGAPATAGADAGGSGGSAGSAAGTGTSGASGSGSTAGAGGGGGSAGSGGSGGGSVDCKAFKLCDDFEGDAPGMGMSPWKVTQGGGYTVMIDTTQAHSGMKSVHITAPVDPGSGVLKETSTFPATEFWGRAWMRFKAASGGHQMFIAVITSGDQFRLLNTLGSDTFRLNEQNGDKFFASATTIPMEKWFCYEWHVTATSASVYVDGKELTDASPTGWKITGAQSLQIGYQRFQKGPSAGEIWLDDIAINTAQIGCQ
ncbi:MAG: LamG-like jellyroll fold domain-containing protein [Pseudomonadota bacterium]